jgi:hypothetical protein
MRLVSDDYMEPLLEIWVDYSRTPVAIRLAGVLDGTTRSAFLSAMDDVIFEGTDTLVIDAGAVEIGDASGAQALALCHRRARDASRTLIWDGLEFDSPTSRSTKCPSVGYRRNAGATS